METITIKMLKGDVIPIIEMYMFNIFELKERQAFSDEDLDISAPLELYNQELNKLKPVLEELDYVNYVFYDLCEWDYEKHRDYNGSLGFDMEG
jgi:hypothetical protein